MRWPGRTTIATSCPSCGEDLVRGAAWCGACGARVVDEPAVVPDDVAAELLPPKQPRDGGRWTAVVVVVALLATVLAVAGRRTPPPEPLLGRAGNGANLTSTGLPPAGLRLAWSHELPEADAWFEHGSFMAREGLARVGKRIVDVELGTVVRLDDTRSSRSGALVPQVSGQDLVVVDQLRGTVVERHPLPAVVVDGRMWPSQRLGDVTFYAGDEGSAIVRDDGTVLSELPGWVEDWSGQSAGARKMRPEARPDGLRRRPARLPRGAEDIAVAVRSGADLRHGGPYGDLRLVSLLDGRTLLEREGGRPDDVLFATLHGDRALIVWQENLPVEPGADGPPPWHLELVDAVSGAVLLDWWEESWTPPRIVGRTATGGTLLGRESEDGAELWEVTPDGARRDLASLERWNWDSHGDANSLLGTAALTADGLLVELREDRQVVARTLDGAVQWRATAAPDTTSLRADGGVVALLPSLSRDPRAPHRSVVQLLDAADGSRLGSLDLAPSLDQLDWGPRLLSLVDGTLAIGHRGGAVDGPMSLSEARWIDLATGELRQRTDVLAARTDEGTNIGSDLWIAGTVRDAVTGVWQPVVVDAELPRARGAAGRILLLEDGRFDAHELPPHDARSPEGWLQPIGANATTVVATSDSWNGSTAATSTLLLDRLTGDVVDVDGVSGLFVTEDLLVGTLRVPDDWAAPTELVAHDAVTGERRWVGPSITDTQWDLLHDDALLVIGDSLERRAVGLEDGAVRWTHTAAELLRPGGVIGPSHVLLSTTDGEVLALDRRTGEEVWRQDLGAPITSLTGAGDGAVVATFDREVVVLDGRGTAVQRIELADVAFHALALGDMLVVQHPDRVVGYHPDGAGFTADDEVDLP